MLDSKTKIILDSLNQNFFITDSNGNILYSNKSANFIYDLFNFSSSSNLIVILSSKISKFNLLSNLNNTVSYKVQNNNTIYHLSISIKKNFELLENEFVYIFSISDISEFKNQIIENEIYKTIFNNVDASIVLTDTLGNIQLVNPSFTKLTGYTQEEAIGQNPKILKSGYHDDEFFQNMWITISNGHVWKGKLCDRIKSGRIIWEKSTITPIKDENGNIVNYIAIKENITKEKEEEDALKATSYMDFLTEIYNRRKFMLEAEKILSTTNNTNTSIYCFMLDLDNFKKINDNYGHQTGDKILKTFAHTAKNCLNTNDLIARYGGEEFIIIINRKKQDDALKIADDIRLATQNLKIPYESDLITFTVSIGVAKYDYNLSLQELISNADTALYNAKNNGKNRVCFYDIN